VIEVLNKENPEYRDRKGMWQRYWDFYVGGEQLRRNASLYLVRRQKEPNDVYLERLSRVFYENYLGSCIDWYAATLFRTPPSLSFRTANPAVERFFTGFGNDCDCRGTPLLELARRVFIQSLVYRESYVLIDFPRVRSEVATRAEEDAVGKSRAYLVNYTAPQLINWKADRNGAFEWVVLKTHRTFQEAFDEAGLVSEDQWAYYDRERFRVYRLRRAERSETGGSATGEVSDVELVDQGRHGLAEIGRVRATAARRHAAGAVRRLTGGNREWMRCRAPDWI
jgi:hypothetical protein